MAKWRTVWPAPTLQLANLVEFCWNDHEMMRKLQSAWRTLERRSKKLADLQARLLLTVLYYVFVAPTGLAARLSDDALRLHRPRRTATYWLPKTASDHTLGQARRQG